MAQPADEKQESNSDNVWPTALLLNQAYAMTFACVKCKGMPKSCMNNEEGDILCSQCAKDMNNITPNKAMQKILDNLKTRCLSVKYKNEQNNDNVEGGNIIATNIKDNECDWTGLIKEWVHHSKECQFIIVACDDCKSFKCQRQLLGKHTVECPEATINCPKSCGARILRKNTKTHFDSDCAETLLNCTNDDCKMEIKRKNFDNHIQNQCDVRSVECEFTKYGCSIGQLKANQMKGHMSEYKFDHISNKFDFITNKLNTKILEQNDVISKLQQTNNTLSQKINKNKALQTTVQKQQQTIQEMKQKVNDLKAVQIEDNRKINEALIKESNGFKAFQTEQDRKMNNLANNILEMEEKKEPALWKNAVYWNDDTAMKTSGGEQCLVHMILPKKQGKYVCKYSTNVVAASKGVFWTPHHFRLGSSTLCSGTYMHKNMNDCLFPLSGTAIVQLSGNENENERKLGLYHNPSESYPSRMAKCVLEAYQIAIE